jgi:hypothetical protein
MQAGLLPRIMAYAGAINTVENPWREKERRYRKRDVNPNDTENIKIAWLMVG